MSPFIDKAIIMGASGMLGMSVAKYLDSLGIKLLCLGREYLSSEQVKQNFGQEASYLRLAMKDIARLPEESRSLDWKPGENTVFYNFAWGGKNGLTDGTFSDQLDNAIWAAEAVKVANLIGCTKFVSSGSMEETFIEDFLKNNRTSSYDSTQTNYGLAKLAARDMCKIVSYFEGIDYIHTRMSVPLAPDLSSGAYISRTIKKVLRSESYDPPMSKHLYDIVFLDDVVRAYHLIGLRGRNKADYFIGTGRPATLRQHFNSLSHLNDGLNCTESEQAKNQHQHLFDISQLKQDTGFIASLKFDKTLLAL